MRRSNSEIVREAFATYARDGFDAVLELVAPDFEVRADTEMLETGTFTDLEALRAYQDSWEEAWEGLRYEIVELAELDDKQVFVALDVFMRGRGSGIEVKAEQYFLLAIDDHGRFTRWYLGLDRDRALAAAERR